MAIDVNIIPAGGGGGSVDFDGCLKFFGALGFMVATLFVFIHWDYLDYTWGRFAVIPAVIASLYVGAFLIKPIFYISIIIVFGYFVYLLFRWMWFGSFF